MGGHKVGVTCRCVCKACSLAASTASIFDSDLSVIMSNHMNVIAMQSDNRKTFVVNVNIHF